MRHLQWKTSWTTKHTREATPMTGGLSFWLPTSFLPSSLSNFYYLFSAHLTSKESLQYIYNSHQLKNSFTSRSTTDDLVNYEKELKELQAECEEISGQRLHLKGHVRGGGDEEGRANEGQRETRAWEQSPF